MSTYDALLTRLQSAQAYAEEQGLSFNDAVAEVLSDDGSVVVLSLGGPGEVWPDYHIWADFPVEAEQWLYFPPGSSRQVQEILITFYAWLLFNEPENHFFVR